MSNIYKNKSRICNKEFREIVKYFSLGIEATKISKLTGKNRNTINSIIKYIRKVIAKHCEQKSPFTGGEIEIDESYFGSRRIRGIRGRGAKGKRIVFGLIKRKGEVYTQVY